MSRKQREMPAVAPIFDGEKEAKLIALACSKPPKGYARWTLRLLENKVVELGIVDRASDSTICVLVPMLKENELVGVIGIYRQEVRPFTANQIALVMSFATQAVIAIENMRLPTSIMSGTSRRCGGLIGGGRRAALAAFRARAERVAGALRPRRGSPSPRPHRCASARRGRESMATICSLLQPPAQLTPVSSPRPSLPRQTPSAHAREPRIPTGHGRDTHNLLKM